MSTQERSGGNLPMILVPGYWLGGWAWERVVARLDALGQPADAVTLPGLESRDSDRAQLRFQDHVACVLKRMESAGTPCTLVAHSGAGALATAVADVAPDALSRIVFVDSGPIADGVVPAPDLPADAVELPFPGFDTLAATGNSAEGLSEQDKALIQRRAVPQPAGAIREPVRLHNPRRNAVPVTLICCSMPAAAVRDLAESGNPIFSAINDLTDFETIDLPTGHWPMFSRPNDLAAAIRKATSRL